MFSILYMYLNAFRSLRWATLSAIAWLLFFLILILTLLVFRSSSIWVHYEGEVKGR